MIQMIVCYIISDFVCFKIQFDVDVEDCGNNGLLLLQFWCEGDGSVWVLYQVGNVVKVQEYLGQVVVVFNSQVGVLDVEFYFVEIV